MARRKRERQKAPPPPRPTRSISDTLLMRVLDEHHLESLSDIADDYQQLMRALGMKGMKFEETIRVSSSLSMNDRALDIASRIAHWRKQCGNRRMKSETVVLVVSEGASISHIMRELRMRRACVEAHLRGCLAVYSLQKKRCNVAELTTSFNAILAGCKNSRKAKNAISQAGQTVLGAC